MSRLILNTKNLMLKRAIVQNKGPVLTTTYQIKSTRKNFP